MKSIKAVIHEDTKITLNAPFNVSLKTLFNTKRFQIKILKENGDDPMVIVRVWESEELEDKNI